MKNLILILTTFILISIGYNLTYGQVSQEWVQRYSGLGNNDDEANSVAIDGSGNVYVTGSSLDPVSSNDYVTIKYNSNGDSIWVRKYDGPGNHSDKANSIAVDGSGNVYVTGSSEGNGTGSNYATIKYNSSGVQQWVQRYGGAGGYDAPRSIVIDVSGNVYITGVSHGGITGFDFATIKYNSAGVQQWVQRYDGSGNSSDETTSMAVDGSGNVYVTGGCEFDYATIKYNSSGVQQWIKRYNGGGVGTATSIAVDGSGNVFVTGISYSSEPHMDYATIKYNSMGVEQWVQRYNGPGNSTDFGISIAVDGSSNVYVTGSSTGIGTSWDYATIKYNSIGVQQWIQRYNGPANGSDEAQSLALDNSGNVYVTGGGRPIVLSRGDVSGIFWDYATIKYNSMGVEQWVQRYNGPVDSVDYATSIAVDGSGNVFVTGGSIGKGTNYDYATIKYSQTVGIDPISNEIPKEYMLSQNYPNPFNPSTKIKFDITRDARGETRDVRLAVYDAVGRVVTTLVNEKLSPGSYEIDFDGTNFSSGIYFYELNVDESSTSSGQVFSEVKRMILLK